MTPEQDKYRGILIGLAIGDAIGTTFEFSVRDSQPPLQGMVGGGPFRLKAGEWTDDTSMALCLAEALIQTAQDDGQFDAANLMRRFVNWREYGDNSVTGECFDIGITTSQALDRFIRDGDPMAGSSDPRSAGNGSIMRLAPVPIRWHNDPQAAGRAAELQSRTTHAAPECLDACQLMAHLLIALVNGSGLSDALTYAPCPHGTKVGDLRSGDFAGKDRDQIKSSGYVLHTLEAALWSIANTHNAADAILLAANLGDDSDTVAAITGQFAGAIYGYAGFPSDWLNRLAWHDKITELADSLDHSNPSR